MAATICAGEVLIFLSAMPASESLSISQDDYLERILELVQHKGYARIADLATDLKVRGASASGMVKRLAGAGLLEREAYRGLWTHRRRA